MIHSCDRSGNFCGLPGLDHEKKRKNHTKFTRNNASVENCVKKMSLENHFCSVIKATNSKKQNQGTVLSKYRSWLKFELNTLLPTVLDPIAASECRG